MHKDRPAIESPNSSKEIMKEPNELRLCILLESINGLILCCNNRGRLTFASKKAREMLGLEPEEVLKLHISDLVPLEEQGLINKKILTALQELSPLSFEACILDANKKPRLHRLNLSLPLAGKTDDEEVLILLEDLSERRQMEEAFVESEHRLAHIIDFLPDATLAVDCDGRVITWNRAAEKMTGVRAREIIGKGNYEYSLPFYGYRRPLLLDQVLATSTEWVQSYSIWEKKDHTLSGESFCPAVGESGAYLRVTAAPLLDAAGNIIGAIESIQNATQKKRSEEITAIQRDLGIAMIAVNEMEEALSVCLNSALKISGMDAGAIFLVDKAGNKMKMNVQKGLSPEFVEQVKVCDYLAKSSLYKQALYSSVDKLTDYFGDILIREGLKGLMIIPIYHKDKMLASLKMASRIFSRVPEHSRQAIETVANYIGTIIARLQVEEELRESEERYRQLVEVSPDAIAVHINGRVVFINHAGARLLGAEKAEDILGRRIIEFIHPESRQVYINLMEPLAANGVFPLTEMKVILTNGRIIYTEVTGAALIFEGTRAVQIIVRDISVRKKAQYDLSREVYKLRVLYDLAVAMSSTQSMDETLKLTADKSRELFAADCTFIFLINENKAEVIPHTLSGNKMEEWSEIRIPYGKGLVGMVAASERGYICEDYISSTLFSHLFDDLVLEEGLVSGLAAPIIIGNDCLGVLLVGNRKRTVLTQAHLDTLTLIANLVAVEITRDRAEESLQKSLEHLRTVFECTVNALSITAEKKDPYTAGHQRRVASLACAIAQEMKLPQYYIDNVKT
ncbi:MAG: PAS domain S-box protein, partial [Syntrophomonas sp.]|nr:PAS domain S-box protein [Syntrophomonas sp.]